MFPNADEVDYPRTHAAQSPPRGWASSTGAAGSLRATGGLAHPVHRRRRSGICCLLLSVGVIFGGRQAAEAQVTFENLQAQATEALRTESVIAYGAGVHIDDGLVVYHMCEEYFTPAFNDNDPIYYPFRSLLMIEQTRESLKKEPATPGLNPAFWGALIVEAERQVKEQLKSIKNLDRNDPALARYLESSTRNINSIFRDAVKAFARSNNDRFAEVAPAPAKTVVRTNPANGDLQMMHVFEWYICQQRGFDPESVMPHIAVGDPNNLFNGTYIYKISYNNKTIVGPRSIKIVGGGGLEFRSDGSVVSFTPQANSRRRDLEP